MDIKEIQAEIYKLKITRDKLFSEEVTSTELYKAISFNSDFSQDDDLHLFAEKANKLTEIINKLEFSPLNNSNLKIIKEAEQLLNELEILIKKIQW